jgi:cytoskeleton protein RodZ
VILDAASNLKKPLETAQLESFGTRLKREREKRKITLDDISVATKIAPRFLVALESDQFDQLPGGIFNKGFVRSYARHLELDENQTIADFVAASAPVVPEAPVEETPVLAALADHVPQSRIKAKSANDGLPWGMFALLLLAFAFGFSLWGFHSREKSSRRIVVASTPVTATSPVPAPPATEPEAATPSAPETANATSPAAETPATDLAAAPAATTPPAPAGTVPPDTADNSGEFQVLVKARENSWVAITADGKKIVQDTLAAPAEKSVAARNQVVIKTGSVGALDISFNGKKLASQGRVNQVKTLTFDPNGLKH